jgi:hypothetical protein
MEKEFWENKYDQGGISGLGSIGLYRNWKWNKIVQNCGKNIKSIIDVGCGDLRFWQHPIANRIMKGDNFTYWGIDVAENIIKRNVKFYPDGRFICAPAHVRQPQLRASVVLGLDLLFHIMDDRDYFRTVQNLCRYANLYLVIYTWKKNPFESLNTNTDGVSQTFRELGNARHIFNRNDMNLCWSYDVPYDPFGKLYIFRRVIY